MKDYKIKGSKNTYKTPFDLMANEGLLKGDASFNDFENANGDISFYDFVKQANDLLCEQCKTNEGGKWSDKDSARNASSGDYARNASSGDSAQNASSGDSARNASSGDSARNASSGDSAQNASSGDSARNASSGDYARNASSGYSAQNASSGYYAQNASSGYYAQNASSGYSAQNASSGYYAQNASSGDYARNASSGDYARNASSGYSAQNASSGYYAQNASSGDYARNASSGYSARNAVTGRHSVDVSCGYRSITQGVNDTWIALTDYKMVDGKYIPSMVKAGQIGVSTDYKGNVLAEGQFYMLIGNDFVPIDIVDGDYMIPLACKTHAGYAVKSCYYEKNYRENGNEAKKVFVAEKDGICAHGATVKEAIADCRFKHMQSLDVSEHITRIRATGKMDAHDYRLITGACRLGTDRFLQETGHKWDDVKTIEEVLKITAGQWGHDRLKELLND